MTANTEGQEEQFLLRVADTELAERIRKALREEEALSDKLQIRFQDDGREGVLALGDKAYPVKLLDLPTVVESYKTLDDTNLVKTGDIGQMIMVAGQPPADTLEARDGVTPPMRNARERHFRQLPHVSPEVLTKVEQDLLAILDGYAPQGYTYVDVEEEYVVDPGTGQGSWRPVQQGAAAGGEDAG
mmetsp:Transcript_5363/g.11774  ORF Transcript_5363/g.11774 Transcript_5363/m.11774 type:complete len:186 (-) Transcript_5363:24-581(-)